MTKLSFALGLGIGVLIFGDMQVATAADKAMQHGKSNETAAATNDNELINSAMSAAPEKVGTGATIIVAGPEGKMQTLRQGTNGFTCMPDNPTTPGKDPMCLDKAALEWGTAWMERKTPPSGKVGLIYMLAGGTDASNTDPYATKPEPGNNWVETGSHVMIVGADPSFYDMYPKDPKPDTSIPYVMWAGTPYQHLMVPTK
jgi:hypothetical protein